MKEIHPVETYRKIEKAVTDGYQKIEDTVVGGYQKIEDTVVGSYQKVEDAFVGRYLVREGETLPEAKQRLKNQEP